MHRDALGGWIATIGPMALVAALLVGVSAARVACPPSYRPGGLAGSRSVKRTRR